MGNSVWVPCQFFCGVVFETFFGIWKVRLVLGCVKSFLIVSCGMGGIYENVEFGIHELVWGLMFVKGFLGWFVVCVMCVMCYVEKGIFND